MYILEGNIGVGKSTFLKLINERCPDIGVIQEPKDNWASQIEGQSLLENFYKDPHRWAYTIETLAMAARVKDHKVEQENPNPNRIMERSVYSGHYCFARNDYANGFLSSLEWEVYARWVDLLVHHSCRPPKGFIYLRANPETCFTRMRHRNRLGEESISLEYVTQIHEWHERFLMTKEGLDASLKKIPVLVLDASYNLLENDYVLMSYVAQVKDFMFKTQQHAKRLLVKGARRLEAM